MRIFSTLSILGILALQLYACSYNENRSGDTEKKDVISTLFLDKQDGIFRGHQIGEQVSIVKKREKAEIVINSDTLLQYSLSVNSDEIAIYYAFDAFGLFEIQADIFPDRESAADSLFKSMSAHLDKNFGESQNIGVVQRWTTNSAANNIIEITLSNESQQGGEPFISLNYLEPLDDEL